MIEDRERETRSVLGEAQARHGTGEPVHLGEVPRGVHVLEGLPGAYRVRLDCTTWSV